MHSIGVGGVEERSLLSGRRIAMFECMNSRWLETAVMMPGGLLRPMGPSWTVYFRVGSSGQSQEILYLGRYQMRLDGGRTVGSQLFEGDDDSESDVEW